MLEKNTQGNVRTGPPELVDPQSTQLRIRTLIRTPSRIRLLKLSNPPRKSPRIRLERKLNPIPPEQLEKGVLSASVENRFRVRTYVATTNRNMLSS